MWSDSYHGANDGSAFGGGAARVILATATPSKTGKARTPLTATTSLEIRRDDMPVSAWTWVFYQFGKHQFVVKERDRDVLSMLHVTTRNEVTSRA